ncbi:MAG: MltA domain-containing protein [Methylocella sp.]
MTEASIEATPRPLAKLSFGELAGFAEDDHAEAFAVFQRSCAPILADRSPLRQAIAPSAAFKAICRSALARNLSRAEARRFFETHFRPFRTICTPAGESEGFFTGYYEPIVEGSLTRTADFIAPILSRPKDLTSRTPYPDRAAIEAGAIESQAAPIVWLRDPVEVFLIQVQGSARVRLADGRLLRLVYSGRNGQSYTSIGRILIESGEIDAAEMSLATLKHWVRSHGQKPGEAGAALMQRNKSYVFFALDASLEPEAGPVGGAGLSLTPLRSIAIDRALYAYGTPVWIDAALPWRSKSPTPLRRLMIAQDTGSAIVGAARADIFFGSGDDAGARAGVVRHRGDFIVFLPREEGLDP